MDGILTDASLLTRRALNAMTCIDAAFACITAASATVVNQPKAKPWGERQLPARIPNGLVWQLVQWI